MQSSLVTLGSWEYIQQQLEDMAPLSSWNKSNFSCSPLKQKKVDIIVALGEEIPKDTGGITTADLIS